MEDLYKKIKDKKLKDDLKEYFELIESNGLIAEFINSKRKTVAGKVRTLYNCTVDGKDLIISLEDGKLKTIVLENRIMTTPQEATKFNV